MKQLLTTLYKGCLIGKWNHKLFMLEYFYFLKPVNMYFCRLMAGYERAPISGPLVVIQPEARTWDKTTTTTTTTQYAAHSRSFTAQTTQAARESRKCHTSNQNSPNREPRPPTSAQHVKSYSSMMQNSPQYLHLRFHWDTDKGDISLSVFFIILYSN